ncbi:MAG: hypothetical protein J6M07_02295 [Ruminococcus sp.]|nr:hypothetical protein [Ruminococcus sp.]
MKNHNNVQGNIRITSYEDGSPFTTEREFYGDIDEKDIAGFIDCHEFIKNSGEMTSDEAVPPVKEYEISFGGDYENDGDSDTVAELEKRITGHDECIENLYESDGYYSDSIYKINNKLRRAKLAGAALFAVQLLITIGFFCVHHKVEHSSRSLTNKAG